MNNTEKEDGVCENKLCNNLDAQCSISSNSTQGTGSISANNNTDVISLCANCGKGEEESVKLKSCTACKLVKYCSRECQIAHRPQHKKECRKRAAELHDEKLFKQPPPKEDCPICFVQLPSLATGQRYKTCCGKVICSGCSYAPVYDDQGNEVDNRKCAFCRTGWPKSDEEEVQRLKKRMELDDPIAIFNQGGYYREGIRGFPQDYTKALELCHRAAELGHAASYCSIGCYFENGHGVEIDKKKARHYYELSAMGGDLTARYNLGNNEGRRGNTERALKHLMIAVRGGYAKSLEKIKELYSNGHATKEEYTTALRWSTLMRLKVLNGTKLLQHERIIVTINLLIRSNI